MFAFYFVAFVRDLLLGMCPLSTVGKVFVLCCGAGVSALLWDKCSRSTVRHRSNVCQLSALCIVQVFEPYSGNISAHYSVANVRSLLCGKCPRSAVGRVSGYTLMQVYALYCGTRDCALLSSRLRHILWGKCPTSTVEQVSVLYCGALLCDQIGGK
jgi:hypothetical protein